MTEINDSDANDCELCWVNDAIEFAQDLKRSHNINYKLYKNEPYVRYSSSDIAKTIGLVGNLADTSNMFTYIPNGIVVNNDYYVPHIGFLEILTISKKPNIIKLVELLKINLTYADYNKKEVESIKYILKIFEDEAIVEKMNLNKYYDLCNNSDNDALYTVDLYFENYDLIVICVKQDAIQLNKDQLILAEFDSKIIHYNPNVPNFNIFDVLSKIHTHMVEYYDNTPVSASVPTLETSILTKQTEINQKLTEQKYKILSIIDNGTLLYCASDIGKILGLLNVNSNTLYFSKNEKRQIKIMTNGGPQNKTFLTLDGIAKVLIKSRKIETINLAKCFGIDIKTSGIICVEGDTINRIMQTFCGEKMTRQYRVGTYFIDLYFDEYNLAIECDEPGHKSRVAIDSLREQTIKNLIGCHFIRYKPCEKDFDIFNVLNQIYQHISV